MIFSCHNGLDAQRVALPRAAIRGHGAGWHLSMVTKTGQLARCDKRFISVRLHGNANRLPLP